MRWLRDACGGVGVRRRITILSNEVRKTISLTGMDGNAVDNNSVYFDRLRLKLLQSHLK